MIIKVNEFINRPDRTVAGVTVRITEVVWSDGMRSWEVSHKASGKSLTRPGDFEVEEEPTDDDIIEMLAETVGHWICVGCGQTYHQSTQTDCILEHMGECDLLEFYRTQTD